MLSPVLQAEIREAELIGLPLPQRDRESWEETLETYAELYVENEIRQESIVRDMGAFIRFLSVAALESGRWVNYTKMAAAVGVSVNTLRSFYQVLEDTIVPRSPPGNVTARLRHLPSAPSRQKFGDRVTALPWNVF